MFMRACPCQQNCNVCVCVFVGRMLMCVCVLVGRMLMCVPCPQNCNVCVCVFVGRVLMRHLCPFWQCPCGLNVNEVHVSLLVDN